jgi:hypothetical protein
MLGNFPQSTAQVWGDMYTRVRFILIKLVFFTALMKVNVIVTFRLGPVCFLFYVYLTMSYTHRFHRKGYNTTDIH